MRAPVDCAFPLAEYRRRLDAVRRAMADARFDLLLVTSPENICWLSGYESVGYFALQGLLVDHAAEPVLVVRALEIANAEASCVFDRSIGYRDHESGVAVIAREASGLEADGKRIGVELRSRSLSNAQLAELRHLLSDATFVDGFGVVEGPRLLKSELELDCIRRAGKIAEAGMTACLAAIRAGAREREVAAVAYQALVSGGSEWTGAPVFVSSGTRSARGHVTWSDRVLAAGDPVFLEVNASVRRYHAALMRPAAVAPVHPRFQAMCDASRAGLEAALEAARPGVPAATIDLACRRAIDRLGFGVLFRLRTGYSIGLGFENFAEGQLLSLHAGNDTEIKAGMALHLVPYLAEAGFAGCAFSETIIVSNDGAEPLSQVPRRLTVG